MNPNQALWEKGDFTKLAALMRQFHRRFEEDKNRTMNGQ